MSSTLTLPYPLPLGEGGRTLPCAAFLTSRITVFGYPRSEFPQMVYGYFKVRERITHMEAYARRELRRKRRGDKVPNEDIILDADGRYNRFDGGYHKDRFGEIKRHYVIGDTSESALLSPKGSGITVRGSLVVSRILARVSDAR